MKALSCFRKEIALEFLSKKVGHHIPRIICGLKDKRIGVLVFRHETSCGAILIVEFSKDDDYPDKLWDTMSSMRYQTLFVSDCSQSGIHYGMLARSSLNQKCPDYEKAWGLFRAVQNNPELNENLFEALAPLMGHEENKGSGYFKFPEPILERFIQ